MALPGQVTGELRDFSSMLHYEPTQFVLMEIPSDRLSGPCRLHFAVESPKQDTQLGPSPPGHHVRTNASEMVAIELGRLGSMQPKKHDINVGIRWEDDTTAPVWRCTREHAISLLLPALRRNKRSRGRT